MRYSIPDTRYTILASAKKDIFIKRQKYSFHPNFDVFKGEKVYIRISSQFRGLSSSSLRHSCFLSPSDQLVSS